MLAADLLKRKLEVIERVQALRVQSGELVPYIEARDTFASFLREMRTLATAMPAAWAMRCNPVDPTMAQLALEDWIKTYFRALHQNPAGVSIANDAAPRRVKTLQGKA